MRESGSSASGTVTRNPYPCTSVSHPRTSDIWPPAVLQSTVAPLRRFPPHADQPNLKRRTPQVKCVSTLLLLIASLAWGQIPAPPYHSRGYDTTPQELLTIKAKAAAGVQPYYSAVAALLNFATSSPSYWPYGTISGNQSCSGVQSPAYIGGGAPLVQAKVIAWWLTGNAAYAASARTQILELTNTYGYGGETYSGGNQCILNLSREFPPFVFAADLLE